MNHLLFGMDAVQATFAVFANLAIISSLYLLCAEQDRFVRPKSKRAAQARATEADLTELKATFLK